MILRVAFTTALVIIVFACVVAITRLIDDVRSTRAEIAALRRIEADTQAPVPTGTSTWGTPTNDIRKP